MGKKLKHFTIEDIQVANKQLKRCLLSLVIWEMQIKTRVNYYYKTMRMTTFKKY